MFFQVDDLKLCPGPQDISWVLGVLTAKSVCMSTVAFRPGPSVSDTTPDPSVDVSGWEDMNDLSTNSTVIKDLDQPIDITGHVISPFHQRTLDDQDCRFHSIAHLMCYRYAIVNGRKHLRPAYTGRHIQPSVLNRYSVQVSAVDTGPRPFTLKCLSPWGYVLADPDTCPRADIISDVLVNVRVVAAADRWPLCRWLERPHEYRPGKRRARRSLAKRIPTAKTRCLLWEFHSLSQDTGAARHTGFSGASRPLLFTIISLSRIFHCDCCGLVILYIFLKALDL